jgi:ABC-type bacteriocin/lantibiotic exporter with double-glycine peptidase domain
MVVVLCFMFYMNWQLTWIVVVAMPVLVFITQRKMQVALRTYETKFQTWIPSCKNATGIKILQLFNRRKLNPRNSRK